MKINNKKFLFILFFVLIFINFIRTPSIFVVHLFSAMYLVLIYYKFSDDALELAYNMCILFSFNTMGTQINISFAILMFLILFVKNYRDNSQNANYKFNVKSIINKYSIFFIVFVVYITLSFFIADNKGVALKFLLKKYYVAMGLIVVLAMYNKTNEKLNKTMKIFLSIFVGIVFLTLLEMMGLKTGLSNVYADMNFYDYYIKWIPKLFYYNPNNFAVVSVIGMTTIITTLVFKANDKKLDKKLCILFILTEVELIFARSRIAWLTLIAVILFVMIYNGIFEKIRELKKSILLKSTKLILLGITVFFILSFFPKMKPFYGKIMDNPVSKAMHNLILSKSSGSTEDIEEPIFDIEIGGGGSENVRFTLMYDVTQGVFKEKNYLGFGPGNTEQYVLKLDNTHGIGNIHSFWFELLGDFGIFTLCYVIIMYITMMIDLFTLQLKSKSSNKKNIFTVLTWSCIAISLAFSPSSAVSFLPFWFLIGVPFSVVYNKKEYLK
ncbi:O-antigen ligase family protein [Clostridium ihumii]|uniref:O-antigen ligase family protein n=1 Tax=Clostridium ihumii TaxID=1470356 RepID=UPI003D32815B